MTAGNALGSACVWAARDPAFERFVVECASPLLRSAILIVGERDAAEAYARRVLINLSRDRHRRSAARVVEAGWEDLVGDPLEVDHAEAVAGRCGFRSPADRSAPLRVTRPGPARERADSDKNLPTPVL